MYSPGTLLPRCAFVPPTWVSTLHLRLPAPAFARELHRVWLYIVPILYYPDTGMFRPIRLHRSIRACQSRRLLGDHTVSAFLLSLYPTSPMPCCPARSGCTCRSVPQSRHIFEAGCNFPTLFFSDALLSRSIKLPCYVCPC